MKNIKAITPQALISQVTADKLDNIIEGKLFNIIDVRDQVAIEDQGDIPGSINIPFKIIETSMDPEHEDYHAVFEENRPILFCCTGGVMSYMAALKAEKQGIQDLHNLEGGHAAWLSIKMNQSSQETVLADLSISYTDQ